MISDKVMTSAREFVQLLERKRMLMECRSYSFARSYSTDCNQKNLLSENCCFYRILSLKMPAAYLKMLVFYFDKLLRVCPKINTTNSSSRTHYQCMRFNNRIFLVQ